MSLNNLAMFLSGVGRRAEALDPATEAVAIYEKFAAVLPDAFGDNLAIARNTLEAVQAQQQPDVNDRAP